MSQTAPVVRHTLFEDAQALLVAPLFVAFAILLFRQAGLLTGGTVGIAFLLHYVGDWPIGPLLFAINLPFYYLGVRALGWTFTLKTFIAVSLLAVYTEVLPGLITLGEVNRVFAAVMAGFMAGVGLLMLIRHKASLGGIGILAIHLQNSRGWRAGKLQMAADLGILAAAFFVRDPASIALSILGAVALNLVIAVNHKAGRYMGI
ncbi:YitT family protein [Quatrionicoccus australiensis]|uniref:YitT family protein n=1 Tax=Quatrionicoccus australiensis TaxID=138118 RepID=UPI001CF83C5F|nr:YitT family protein [Quatrionicoccus australiensis]UCV15498.1 YitT family protein [Quatrionicoccus australiensis]